MTIFVGYSVVQEKLAGHPPSFSQLFMDSSWSRNWSSNWGGHPDSYSGWGTGWNTDWGRTRFGAWRVKDVGFLYPNQPLADGAHVQNRPIGFQNRNFVGYNVGSFKEVFYDRVLIEPTVIEFGNILSTQTQIVEIWNAFFIPVTLDDLIKQNFDDGTLVEDITLPFVYQALQESSLDIIATTSGDPTVDATLIFDFSPPVEDIPVSITGSRIVLFPVEYRPNLTETFSWLTQVLNSYNGTEQRIKMRTNPRQSLDVQAYLPRNELHRIENLIYGWRKRTWAIPIWMDAKPVTSPVTGGDLTVLVDTVYSDFRVDSLAILWLNPRTFSVFQIVSMTDTSLTTNRGITGDWPATTTVVPVRGALMKRDPVRSFSGYDGFIQASFEVTDNITLPSSPSAQQFENEDTFLDGNLIPDGGDEAEDSYVQRIDRMDFGTGLVTNSGPWQYTRVPRAFEIELRSIQEVWEFKEWLMRRAGKVRPFYMPTFENNFVIISEGTIIDAFVAKPNDYQAQSLPRNHIAILLTDGTYELRTVVDAVLDGEGNLAVSFTPSLGLDASLVDEVSLMTLRRLDTDNVSIKRLQNNVSFAKIPTIEIAP